MNKSAFHYKPMMYLSADGQGRDSICRYIQMKDSDRYLGHIGHDSMSPMNTSLGNSYKPVAP